MNNQKTIENVVLYIADSLRFDYHPHLIAERGITFKTVAQSLHSPSSFATLLTGLYVGEHGVHGWNHKLPENMDTLCGISGYDTSFYQADSEYQLAENDPIFPVLHQDVGRPISELQEPFIYVERDLTPHVPYGDDVSNYDSAGEYFKEIGKDYNSLELAYQHGVDRTAENFENLIESLDNRSLLETTLIVFTSDHGELLGEYGSVAHNSPMSPELVYVPTTFIHPSLSTESFNVDADDSVIEHVDIVNTVLELINIKSMKGSGIGLTSENKQNIGGLSSASYEVYGKTLYESAGWFGYHGAFVQNRNSLWARLLYFVILSIYSSKRYSIRRNPVKAATPYLTKFNHYKNPRINKSDALDILKHSEHKLFGEDHKQIELDEAAKDHLRSLGYLE